MRCACSADAPVESGDRQATRPTRPQIGLSGVLRQTIRRIPARYHGVATFPLLATVCLIGVEMAATTWWQPMMFGRSSWILPGDIWGTLIAARRLMHLNLAGLYLRPTGLISFPGAALILVPVVAVAEAAGISLHTQAPHHLHPASWLLAGPYQVAVSAVLLFAADVLAERLGASVARRAFLATGEAVALWSVTARWGHPEDAVALGLLLFAMIAQWDGRTGRAGWLTGAAVAAQPLVLLALPVIIMSIEPRRVAGFLVRAATPAAVLLGAAAAANWSATYAAVIRQPNWPAIDHPTPWISLAPRLASGAVAAGPGRLIAVAVACGCGWCARHVWRRHGWRRPTDDPAALASLLWWIAAALAVRCAFEAVMVAYYVWPALAVALIVASANWRRLAATATAAAALTFGSQLTWRGGGTWGWWSAVVAGLAVTVTLARIRLRRPATAGTRQPT